MGLHGIYEKKSKQQLIDESDAKVYAKLEALKRARKKLYEDMERAANELIENEGYDEKKIDAIQAFYRAKIEALDP